MIGEVVSCASHVVWLTKPRGLFSKRDSFCVFKYKSIVSWAFSGSAGVGGVADARLAMSRCSGPTSRSRGCPSLDVSLAPVRARNVWFGFKALFGKPPKFLKVSASTRPTHKYVLEQVSMYTYSSSR